MGACGDEGERLTFSEITARSGADERMFGGDVKSVVIVRIVLVKCG